MRPVPPRSPGTRTSAAAQEEPQARCPAREVTLQQCAPAAAASLSACAVICLMAPRPPPTPTDSGRCLDTQDPPHPAQEANHGALCCATTSATQLLHCCSSALSATAQVCQLQPLSCLPLLGRSMSHGRAMRVYSCCLHGCCRACHCLVLLLQALCGLLLGHRSATMQRGLASCLVSPLLLRAAPGVCSIRKCSC